MYDSIGYSLSVNTKKLMEIRSKLGCGIYHAGSLCMDNDGYCSEDRLCMKPGVDYVSVLGLSVVTKTVSRWFDGYW